MDIFIWYLITFINLSEITYRNLFSTYYMSIPEQILNTKRQLNVRFDVFSEIQKS